ncbi:MAG: efflux RND transporter periplasmic adaptor subunit [Pseudomonadales bacterium]
MTPTKILTGVLFAVAVIVGGIYLTVIEEHAAESAESRAVLTWFRAEPFLVGVAIDPAIPRVGTHQLTVEVLDASRAPIVDVVVDAYAEMAAMGAMAAMRAPVELELIAPGQLEGVLQLPMRGEWPLTVVIRSPTHGDARLQFDLATDREGLRIAAGAMPVGGASATAGADGDVITIDNRRRQMIGVETDEVTMRDLVRTIRAVGRVTYDERLLSNITLKFDGYIGELNADYVGAPVTKGQVLFTVYSPELLAAQQEYLETRKRLVSRGPNDSLVKAARQRLQLWDLSPSEIEALERRGETTDFVAFRAPRTGTLVERNIVSGSAARRGQTLLSIADLSRVWVEAQVYEADLALVREGMSVTVTLPYLPDRRYVAEVEYVYPYLEGDSRTGRIRVTLDNAAGLLKPEMYAEVLLDADLGRRLSVPEEAIIVAGESRVVFVDLGGGRLRPVRIRTGRRGHGFVEVLDGLELGDVVVTSGNFLIAAETRLKTGIDQW